MVVARWQLECTIGGAASVQRYLRPRNTHVFRLHSDKHTPLASCTRTKRHLRLESSGESRSKHHHHKPKSFPSEFNSTSTPSQPSQPDSTIHSSFFSPRGSDSMQAQHRGAWRGLSQFEPIVNLGVHCGGQALAAFRFNWVRAGGVPRGGDVENSPRKCMVLTDGAGDSRTPSAVSMDICNMCTTGRAGYAISVCTCVCVCVCVCVSPLLF